VHKFGVPDREQRQSEADASRVEAVDGRAKRLAGLVIQKASQLHKYRFVLAYTCDKRSVLFFRGQRWRALSCVQLRRPPQCDARGGRKRSGGGSGAERAVGAAAAASGRVPLILAAGEWARAAST